MRKLGRAVGRRLLLLVMTVAAAVALSAVLVRYTPGFGMDERQLDLRFSSTSLASIRAESDPPGFRTWLAGLAHGDWGTSTALNRPVRDLVVERAGVTLRILGTALAAAWAASALVSLVLLGIRRRAFDTAVTIMAGALLCLPAAVVALFAMYSRAGASPALALVLFPRVLRYTSDLLQATARRPHVLAAHARGVAMLPLIFRHIWRPAAPELLALAGVSVSLAAGAAIPVEALCDAPGLGQLVWQAALGRDFPVLVVVTALVAVITCVANLLSDAGRALVVREA
jgi:peptide/nickel transport system permease protein